ncbi:DHH phosphoesterase [Testicularia cyperi]|uniref:DHH phosphoesterase n=1 Tax=Testicularia cyperi TaxID=1882483 RepID=A0A317XVA0_9BASI|nr:DHH phosphoesterase [Testicularia cyperi]
MPKRKQQTTSTGSGGDDKDDAISNNSSGSAIKVARLSETCSEWPAPPSRMADAVAFLRQCAASKERVLIVPDKDADGLCSGVIMHRTLIEALDIDPSLVDVHLMTKGSSPSESAQRDAMAAHNARYIIVLDQGSRNSPPLVPGAEHGWDSRHPDAIHTMVLDHHFLAQNDPGPKGCLMVNACHHEPVATASLLTWVICRPLWTDAARAEERLDYVATLGTMGDLSVRVKWDPPFPDLTGQVKRWTSKRFATSIALLNAPRRTPDFDVITAWEALLASTSPISILDPAINLHAKRLYEARDAVSLETERCTHTPPKFSKDGRVALLRIKSPYQVHPSIATRWTGALKSKHLQVVMCANSGYQPGHTNFSCRIAQVAKSRGEEVNIIHILNSYADRDPQWKQSLMQELGGNAFNGHIQASGGIFPHHHFDKFCDLMQIGVPPDHPAPRNSPKKASRPTQKNNLLAMGFSASPAKKT